LRIDRLPQPTGVGVGLGSGVGVTVGGKGVAVGSGDAAGRAVAEVGRVNTGAAAVNPAGEVALGGEEKIIQAVIVNKMQKEMPRRNVFFINNLPIQTKERDLIHL